MLKVSSSEGPIKQEEWRKIRKMFFPENKLVHFLLALRSPASQYPDGPTLETAAEQAMDHEQQKQLGSTFKAIITLHHQRIQRARCSDGRSLPDIYVVLSCLQNVLQLIFNHSLTRQMIFSSFKRPGNWNSDLGLHQNISRPKPCLGCSQALLFPPSS